MAAVSMAAVAAPACARRVSPGADRSRAVSAWGQSRPAAAGVKRVAVKQLPAQQVLRMGSVQIGAGAVRSNNNNNGAAQHRRGELQATAAITAPEEGTGEGLAWRRMVDGGVEQASDIWAGVNSAAAAAAKGTWEGIKPVRKVLWSDVLYSPKRAAFMRKWQNTDITYASFIGVMHLGCLLAPFTFTWSAFNCFLVMYFITGCLGITLSYHRQLSHKAFSTPKWVEYTLAYCGAMAVQGDPLEWVSSHRHHHQHCDTPKDPHTPYEGFWWSHCGWLLDNEATLQRVGDRSNAQEVAAQPFYQWMEKTYMWHVAAQAAVLTALGSYFGGGFLAGGLPWLVWGFCVRTCWVYHITWAVNSVSHVWGSQTFNTGDLSRNNWWIGILAFGEGWHNNHHAFEFSARHGLEWWQVDMTWMMVCILKFFGLADKVKLPKEAQMDRMRIKKGKSKRSSGDMTDNPAVA